MVEKNKAINTKKRFNTIVLILFISFYVWFLWYGRQEFKEWNTEKSYNGTVIHKHQGLTDGKHPSEALVFVVKLDNPPIEYNTEVSVSTWYKFEKGSRIVLTLNKSDVQHAGCGPLIGVLWLLAVVVTVLIIIVLVIFEFCSWYENLSRKADSRK